MSNTRSLLTVLVLCLGFAIAMQFYLMTSISVFGIITCPLCVLIAILGIPISLIGGGLFLFSICTGKSASMMFKIGLISFVCGVYACGSVLLGETWIVSQRAWNIQQGNRVVAALVQYRTDHGKYPTRLEELRPKYLQHIPKWKHGFVKYRFRYWFDDDTSKSNPKLKFCSGLWTGFFYIWQTREWKPHTL